MGEILFLVTLLAFAKWVVFLSCLRPVRDALPIPVLTAVSLTAAVSAVLCHPPDPQMALDTASFMVLLIQSAADGLVQALPLVIAIESLTVAVRAIDVGRGAFFAEQMGLEAEGRGSQLEQAALLGATVIFFSQQGHHIILQGLFDFSAGELAQCMVGHGPCDPQVVTDLLRSVSASLSRSLLLVFPALLVLALTDVGGQILAKFSERIPIYTELSGLKMLLGFVLAGLGLWCWG